MTSDTRPPATATDLARLAEAWKDAEVALREIEPLRKANANWRATYEQQQIAASEARTAFFTALSALQAEVREVTGPIAEAVGSIGMDKRGNDYVVLPYKTRDGEYHEYKSLRLEHLRHAAALHEKMEG